MLIPQNTQSSDAQSNARKNSEDDHFWFRNFRLPPLHASKAGHDGCIRRPL